MSEEKKSIAERIPAVYAQLRKTLPESEATIRIAADIAMNEHWEAKPAEERSPVQDRTTQLLERIAAAQEKQLEIYEKSVAQLNTDLPKLGEDFAKLLSGGVQS